MTEVQDVLALQDRVFEALPDPAWLRRNSEAMIESCFTLPNRSCTAYRNGQLVGFSTLFRAGRGPESLARLLTDDVFVIESSANVKTILVDPDFRGRGVARDLLDIMVGSARLLHIARLHATVHPNNEPSRSLFRSAGFEPVRHVVTSYGPRDVWERVL